MGETLSTADVPCMLIPAISSLRRYLGCKAIEAPRLIPTSMGSDSYRDMLYRVLSLYPVQ